MSNVPAERPTTDIVDKDKETLDKFIESGLPGIGDVTQPQISKMFDLYLNGKTYSAISGIMRVQKPIVLYLSHKLNWFESKQEYLVNFEKYNKQRVIEFKLMKDDFLLNIAHVLQKKIGSRLNRYLATDNEEFTNQINLKELDRYLKVVEMLEKTVAIPQAKSPLVGLTIPEGATLTRKSDNEIEVTPRENAQENMLKRLADLEREKDKK